MKVMQTIKRILCFLRSTRKAEYSGMTVQVGNPSFLYEEMLDDYEDTNADPDLKSIQEEKVLNWEKRGIRLN